MAVDRRGMIMFGKWVYLLLFLAGCYGCAHHSMAQSPSTGAIKPISTNTSTDIHVSPAGFDASAGLALQAMKARAEELKIGGVAVLAYFEGDKIQSWTSKMLVIGRLKDEPTASDKGANLLGIAYAKASEMADTLKDSGSQVRAPMTGEFGWEGGVIVRVKTGYLIAAFSGGKSADDVAVSRTGATKIVEELRKPK